MKSGDKVRVAVWGVGSHVRRNLISAFERSSHADLVAIHTRSEDTLREVANMTGTASYRDPDRLLAASNIDAIYIATPTGLHASMAIATIAAGKHVWCEKPLTVSVEETKKVIGAAVGAGLVALEADMFLHHPQFVELRRLVESSELGPIVSMTGRFGFPFRSRSDFRYSRELGGGALLDAGFYPVAAAVALLGADLRTVGAVVRSDTGFEVDTGGTALVEASGRAGVLDWGFGRSYRNEIEIWCQDGSVSVDRAFSKPADLMTEIIVRPQSGDLYVVPTARANQFALMLDNLAAVTMGEIPYDPASIVARSRLLTEIDTLGGVRPEGGNA